jgi:XTP/dITP diphosphohydrolase
MSQTAFLSLGRELVIGTRNRKKGAELAELLAEWGFCIINLADAPGAIEIAEDGESFAANARLKAAQQARHLGRWVLADDSGLEVDALGGAPGVYSARYALQSADSAASAWQGPHEGETVDAANNRRLLFELTDVPLEGRTARYVCHVAVADPAGTIRAESVDSCCGRIRFSLSGSHGFGYDPLFEIVEYHRTFGELGPAVKRAISHRSRALRAIWPQLLALRG